jgi:hypothetical protein
MRSSSELPETSIPATIRRRLEGRLEQLNARLPRLEARAASSDDFEAEGLLFAARRELTDLEQALRGGSEKQGAWDPRRIEVNDTVVPHRDSDYPGAEEARVLWSVLPMGSE